MSFYDTPYVVPFSEPEKQLSAIDQNWTARLGVNPGAKYDVNVHFYQDPEGNWYKDFENISVNPWQAMMGQAPKNAQDVYNKYKEGVTQYFPYLSKEDYKSDPNLEYVGINDPESAKELFDLKNTDPKQYANKMASFLSDVAFSAWAQNRDTSDVLNHLEAYKKTNPDAYYNAYLSLKGKEMGWNAGNGAADRNAPMQQEINSIVGDALKSGLNPNDINSSINKNYSDYAGVAARTNAVNAASGGGGFNFGTDMLPGLKLIGGALLGAGAADYLATGAEAANAASTTGEALSSTGFTPVDGASFAIDPTAFYGLSTPSIEAAPALDTTTNIVNSSGFTPTDSSSFTISPNASYTTGVTQAPTDIGLGTNAPLQGPTYQELGVTGVPEGGMGPTYGEMGNTGLNTEQAISAADNAANLQQAKDALSTANDVKNAAKLAKALTSTLGSQAGSKLTNAAQNLVVGQTGVGSAIPALLRGNQNPFLQTAQQPIRSNSDLASLAQLLKQG